MHNLHSKCVHSEAEGNWHIGNGNWDNILLIRYDNMMLICKTVGNMDIN
jgi:hypothetical protein